MGNPATQFKNGNPGKPKGAVTVITKTVREIVLETFLELQKDPKHSFKAFCKKYPIPAMQICAKLIPTAINAELRTPDGITINFTPADGCKPIGYSPEQPDQGSEVHTGILGEQESL